MSRAPIRELGNNSRLQRHGERCAIGLILRSRQQLAGPFVVPTEQGAERGGPERWPQVD